MSRAFLKVEALRGKVPSSRFGFSKGWEGGQHVMQSRSIRRSGQPTCATASSNARFDRDLIRGGIMASGHVNRTNRPNTWLHRPGLRREDSPTNPEPSTHGTTRTSCNVRHSVAIGDK